MTMIYDKARVEKIRVRMKGQLELIKTLESKIAKGKLDPLRVARLQTEDVETLYLRDLDRKDRSPAEEAQWLPLPSIIFRHGDRTSRRLKSSSASTAITGLKSLGNDYRMSFTAVPDHYE